MHIIESVSDQTIQDSVWGSSGVWNHLHTCQLEEVSSSPFSFTAPLSVPIPPARTWVSREWLSAWAYPCPVLDQDLPNEELGNFPKCWKFINPLNWTGS